MALYVIHNYKKANPNKAIHFVVDYECKSLVENHPEIEKSWVLPRNQVKTANTLQESLEALSSLSSLFTTPFDCSFNLYQDDSGAFIQALIVARTKKGKVYTPERSFQIQDPWARYLYAIPANRKSNFLHVIDIYHKICNIPSTHAHCFFPTTAYSLPYQKYCVLQPGSAWPAKAWPEEYWAELVPILLENLPVVLLGAPQESFPILEKIKHPGFTNLIGKTSLLEIVPILQSAEYLVTGDTFAMHVAASQNTKVYALFGASSATETGPYGIGNVILKSNHKSNEDFDFPNKEHLALQELSSSIVAATILGELPPKEETLFLNSSYSLFSQQNSKESLSYLDDRNLDSLSTLSARLDWDAIQANYQELESLESALALETNKSLCWEFYRISLNSIPVKPITAHIAQRTKLLQKMLKSNWNPAQFYEAYIDS